MGFYGFVAGAPFTEVLFYYLEANSLWLSAVLLAVSWWMLKRINVVRISEKLCDVPTMDMFSVWNMEKAKRVAEYRAAKRKDSLGFGIAALLEKLMRASSTRSVKYGYGLAIIGCGFTVINLWTLLAWLPLIIFFCYIPVEGFAVRMILFIIPAFFPLQLANAARIPLLCACGRKERLKGALLGGLVYAALITASLFVMVLMTVVLDSFMPSFTAPFHNDVVLDFQPLKFRYIMIVFFTMPIVYAFSTISPRIGLAASVFAMYCVIGVMFAEKILRAEYSHVLASYPALLILPLILICGVSYLIMRRQFLRCDFKGSR